MLRYLIRRVIAAVAVLFGVSVLIFTLLKITPGDPAQSQLPPNASQEQLQALRVAMGLDRSIVYQYFVWLSNALQGDLGNSYQHRIGAFGMVTDRFGNTAILAGTALCLAVVAGVAIGILAGTRPLSAIDRIATTLSVLAASIPTFWLGIMLLIIFSLNLQWFPAVGMYDPRGDRTIGDLLSHLVLPAITISVIPAAIIARLVRSSVLETMTHDYVRTARAKGLTERAVVWRHAMRNTLPAFITIVALQAGYLLGGSLIAEIVFSWPGIGLQLYTAVGARDVPVIMTVTLLVALVFTSLNLLADMLQGVVDPRIRLT